MENKGKTNETSQDQPSVNEISHQPPTITWKSNKSRKRLKIGKQKELPHEVKDKVEGDDKVKLNDDKVQCDDDKVQGDSATRGRKQSWIWNHFTRFKKDDEPKASCNYCGDYYAAEPGFHGTSNLIRHYNFKCKKNPHRVVDDKQKTLVFESNKDGNMTLKSARYSYEECRLKLVEMVIVDELPFRFVEGDGFRRFVASLQPKFDIPSRITIARDCMKLYIEEKKRVKKLIKSKRVSLTTDTWTSIQNINYMCLTAHWVDEEWKLQKRILSFRVIPNHKGKTIGKMIENCLLDWGIDKLLTITVDNASSNDTAINYLKKNTKGWKTTILDHEFLHMRCCAHILNLIVKDGLKHQDESILKIRNAIRYVRSSPARLETFTTCVEAEKIESKSSVFLDVETRWNSTYLMLDSAVKFEKAFERLKDDDSSYKLYFALGNKDDDRGDETDDESPRGGKEKGKGSKYVGPPTEEDWKVAKSFIKFLKLFYDVTLKFSGSLSVTSNTFFQEVVAIKTTLHNLSIQSDSNVSIMASKMQSKFTKYWEDLDKLNYLLYVAIVLDPRYKMKFVKFCFKQVYDNNEPLSNLMIDRVRRVLVRLYDCYQSFDAKQSTHMEASSSSLVSIDNMEVDGILGVSLSLASQFEKQLEEDESDNTKSELDIYLGESCRINFTSFDVLGWWRDNAERFPIISQMARDILAIPVSTVASESTFSTSGRLLDSYRSSLNPEMVEALVCCQNWLKMLPVTIDIHGLTKEVPPSDVEKYAEVIRDFHKVRISDEKHVIGE